MPRKLEVADDLRPQQRHDVAEHGEPEAREQLLGHGGAAQDVALLEDERLHAGPREVRRAHEPVVATTDDDRVVALAHVLLLADPAGLSASAIHPAYVSSSLADGRRERPRVLTCVQHIHTWSHTMGLVRTNITLPEETLALVDAVAGPRGRSRYIAEVVAKQVRRDNARLVWEKYAGFLKDSTRGANTGRNRPSARGGSRQLGARTTDLGTVRGGSRCDTCWTQPS